MMVQNPDREALGEILKDLGSVEQVRANRLVISAGADRAREVLGILKEVFSCDRLITMSSVDTGEMLELIYHLTGPHRVVLSVSVKVPRSGPAVPTVSDILPPAGLYERQIHDLLGIDFPGHPGLKRIVLNENWPEGEYPLRKDWKPAPETWYGGPGKEGRHG